MKKNLVTLIIAVVILGGLIGAYSYLQNRQPESAEIVSEATEAPYYYLTDRNKDELTSFTLENNDGKMSFAMREKEDGSAEWYIEEYAEAALNANNVNSLSTSAYSLSTDMKITDEPQKLGDYGLDPPAKVLSSKFSDGSESIIYIGNMTPARDYYYAMREGDPALYALYKYTGDRFNYTINNLLNAAVPIISPENLIYAYINEAGKPEIEMGFDGSEEEKSEQIQGYGAVILTMFKPYAGREIYVSNFSEFILKEIANLKVNNVVEYDAQELSKYGLEEPGLEVILEDINGKLHIYVGDETEDGNRYCILDDENWVFKASSTVLDSFYNVKVNSFIERFVALVFINSLEKIEIRSDRADYDIVLNMETDDEGYEVFFPTVDGQEVQELAFKTFYQRLIGLSYDTEIPIFEPEGDPAVTITYYPFDEDPIVTRYYDYNNDFYAVQKADYDVQFVVSKHSMNIMQDAMIDLLAGKLDRDY